MAETNRSKIIHLPDRNEVKEQAALWLVRLDQGSLSPKDINALTEWMARSDVHTQYLLRLAKDWESMSVMQELSDIFPLDTDFAKSRYFFRKPVGISRRGLAQVASLLVISCIVVASVWLTKMDDNLYITEIGQRSQWLLPDGTSMDVNTNSRVETDFDGDLRIVRLIYGEASFDVVKNPRRPFIVYAGNGLVQAVGTEFSVRFTSDSVDVVVSEGTVKVFSEAEEAVNKAEVKGTVVSGQPKSVLKEVLATAGQSVSYTDVIDILSFDDETDLERKLSWRKNALIFSGEPLSSAVLEIERYTTKQLVITDKSIENLPVGGHFKTDDIDALLESIALTFNLHVSHLDSQRVEISSL